MQIIELLSFDGFAWLVSLIVITGFHDQNGVVERVQLVPERVAVGASKCCKITAKRVQSSVGWLC